MNTARVTLHDSSNAQLHLKKTPNPHSSSLSVTGGTVNGQQYMKDRDSVFLKRSVCHANKNKMLVKIQFSCNGPTLISHGVSRWYKATWISVLTYLLVLWYHKSSCLQPLVMKFRITSKYSLQRKL